MAFAPVHSVNQSATGFRFALGMTLAALLWTFAQGYPQHSNPWLLSWIPPACCVTNDCCWEVSESEVRAVPPDSWEILATGQVQRRTDWSPDGKFYRCACDLSGARWIRHEGAFTRCLFVPMRTVGDPAAAAPAGKAEPGNAAGEPG